VEGLPMPAVRNGQARSRFSTRGRSRWARADDVKPASPIVDQVPWDSAGALEIGFHIPQRYNASDVLFHNLKNGRAERPAAIGPAGARTFAQLCADANRWGNALLSLGLNRGDRVLLFLDDTPVYPAAFFGAVRAGLVPLLINLLTPPDLLRFYLVDSAAKVAITEASFCDRFAAADCEDTRLQTLIIVNGEGGSDISIDVRKATAWLSTFSERLAPADTHRDDMAFWMYSSGSTGRPKGIIHLQHDMAYTARSYAQHILELTPNDICFSVPKIFFSYGFGNSITFPYSAGAASLLLPGQPKPDAIFAAIAQYRPTVFFGLPTLYTALTNAPGTESADFSSIRLAISAAEILSADVFNAWKAMTGLEIVEGLGSTEALNVYLSNTPHKKKLGSAGMRIPGYELALKDRQGKDVAEGAEGILWVRGHANTPGYWNRADKTLQLIRSGGWICTGDRFVRDRDGFYFFRGRADDLIKVSGQWVHPLEVQLCLAEHPEVRECAVVAVELPDRRMRLEAFVVINGSTFDREEATRVLQDYVKRRLLPHKYPRVIRFLSELPKTGTGKIDRQTLLQSVAADVPPNEPADPVPSHHRGSADCNLDPDAPSSRERNVIKLAGRRHLQPARSDTAAG
jgi:benzoate-CoA ligase family protein